MTNKKTDSGGDWTTTLTANRRRCIMTVGVAMALLPHSSSAFAQAAEEEVAAPPTRETEAADRTREGEAPQPADTPPDERVEQGEVSTQDAQAQKIAALEARLAAVEAEQAEAAALEEGLQSEGGSLEELTTAQPLKIYGFIDIGFQKTLYGENSQLSGVLATDASTFVLGNANIFFDAKPLDDWRALLEVRFTNLPHGSERSLASPLGDSYVREDTSTVDFTSPSFRGNVTLGSTIIERAWIEWTHSDLFRVRSGYFLTPFGIWNMDHGTPTLISLVLPAAQADEFFPNRQLGLELLGSTFTGELELGYHAYVSNGRPFSQVDFSDSKSIGGRLFLSSLAETKVGLGVSGFYGSANDIRKEIVSFIPYRVETTDTVALEEYALGADASMDLGSLRLRGELTVNHSDYEAGKRRNFVPDGYKWDAYLLGAYRLPWAGLEPYAYGEYLHLPSMFGDTVWVASLGLNIHFTPFVQLKTQAARAFFMDLVTDSERTPSDNNGWSFTSRLVMSF